MDELGWRPLPEGYDLLRLFPKTDSLNVDEFFAGLSMNLSHAFGNSIERTGNYFVTFCRQLDQKEIGKTNK